MCVSHSVVVCHQWPLVRAALVASFYCLSSLSVNVACVFQTTRVS